MSTRISFEQARQDHIGWMVKMRSFIDGKIELIESEVVSHLQCRLGKWYESEGRSEFGYLEQMQKFDLKHIKLHRLARSIYDARNDGDTDLAEDWFNDLSRTSKEIVALLHEAEDFINKDLIKEDAKPIPVKLSDDVAPWDKSNVLIIKTNGAVEIEYLNKFFSDVFGFENKDLIGKSLTTIIHPDVPTCVSEILDNEIKNGRSISAILKFITSNGKNIWAIADYVVKTNSNSETEEITIKLSGMNQVTLSNFIEPLYKELVVIEKRQGHKSASAYLGNYLEERNRTFNEYTSNLIMTGRDSVKSKEKKSWFGRLFS